MFFPIRATCTANLRNGAYNYTPMVELMSIKPITWIILIDILIVVKIVTKVSVVKKL